jgi:RNA polymerase sigma-70 factor (ECF subfamily)
MVNAAGATSDSHSRKALTELCQIYWPPLYSYLRRRGHDREEAEDLTQGFFARLLERNDIRAADPLRGRFRGFLLTSL